MNSIVKNILFWHPHKTENISKQALSILLDRLVDTKLVDGAVLELGCHMGLTSVYIRRVLDRLKSKKEMHVYDSFEGLPEKKLEDTTATNARFLNGSMSVNEEALIEKFKIEKLKVPIIHKGWFKDVDYPERISFVFLDGDFYQSILDGLTKVVPHMSPGGIICIHDYKWDMLPGVEKACLKYFGDPSRVKEEFQGLGVVYF